MTTESISEVREESKVKSLDRLPEFRRRESDRRRSVEEVVVDVEGESVEDEVEGCDWWVKEERQS